MKNWLIQKKYEVTTRFYRAMDGDVLWPTVSFYAGIGLITWFMGFRVGLGVFLFGLWLNGRMS